MMKTSSSLWLRLISVMVFTMQCIHCGMHNFPGETQPPRVEIKINSSANVTCRMNLTKFGGHVNSSSLYFVEEDTGRRVPDTDIEILNDTTIVFMLRNAKEQDRNYVCKSGVMGIGITHVSVGTAPQDITDFKCHGYDYTYMVCKFTIPQNVILTQYNLSYTAQSAYRIHSGYDENGKALYKIIYSQDYIQICQLEIQPNLAICNLTAEQNNYRTNHEFFNFTLTGQNDVGTNVQNFWINHYESVIPPRPEYTFEKITNNSVVIKWTNIKYFFYKDKGLQYEIRLRPKHEGIDWQDHSNYEISNNRSETKLILRNIPFAYFWYELSVRVRVKKPRRTDDSYWSQPFVKEFRTAACRPETAPLTDVGSFYIDPTETKLQLYWRQLPYYKENGPEFGYIIKEVKVNGVLDSNIKPIHIDRTSAVFNRHRHKSYEFVIKSKNADGESPNNSTILIPAWPRHHERSAPQYIKNIYHDSNQTYTLSWSPPTRRNDLIDYTVFWCQSKKAMPTECKDTIFFRHVNATSTTINSTSTTLNLAVSANYRDFNTGMHWVMCTAEGTTDLVKMEPEVISYTARNITVQWSTDRVCSSLLEGYNLTYCRLHNRANNLHTDVMECAEEPITVTISSVAKNYTIKRLKPYSSYKIEMLVYSKLKQGKISDALVVNTAEEAPSKPLHLKARNITSNSAVLTWYSPEHHNGNLRHYRVEYNTEHHIIDCLSDDSACSHGQMKFTLENLSSYTSYKVYVVAYTTTASEHSNDIKVDTLVGIPSNPRHIKTKENSQTILQWSKPEVPSGRVEFYQVAIMVWYKDVIQRQHLSNVVDAHECVFHLPVCKDADYRFTLQMRAVNVAKLETEIDHYIFAAKNLTSQDIYSTNDDDYFEENKDLECVATSMDAKKQLALIQKYSDSKKYVQYKSVWEKGPVTNCSDTKLSRITMLALLVVVSSIGVMAAFYVARNKYQKMANIQCALPPGLEAMSYPTKDNGDGGDFRRSKDSFYNNESRHLLSSISHDSGYHCHNGDPHNNDGKGIDGLNSGSLGKSSGYMGSDHSTVCCNADATSSHSCVVEQTPTVDDAYMVMELLKPSDNKLKTSSSQSTFDHLLSQSENNGGYVQPSLSAIAAFSANKNTRLPSSFLPTENGYIKPMSGGTMTNNPASFHDNLQMKPSESGYIKPQNMLNWSTQKFPQSTAGTTSISVPFTADAVTANSSAYVAPQMLLKPPNENGYTSLDVFGSKSLGPTQTSISETFGNPEGGGGGGLNNIIPPISGYVTQRELSAFGQQQKLN